MARDPYDTADMPPGDSIGDTPGMNSSVNHRGFGATAAEMKKGYTRVQQPSFYDRTHRDFPDADGGFTIRAGVPVER